MRWRAAALIPFLLAPLSAHAQDGHSLSAGYSYGQAEDESLHGWTASLAFRLHGPLSLVAEATGHYGGLEGADLTRVSLLAGPRWSFGSGSTRPFVQALAGAVRSSVGIEVLDVSISESSTDFGGAAGAGIDIGLGGRWALRLQGDYALVVAEGETRGDPRASAQAVYRWGGK